jgi:hypothetical protein
MARVARLATRATVSDPAAAGDGRPPAAAGKSQPGGEAEEALPA